MNEFIFDNITRRYIPVSFKEFVSNRYYVGDLCEYLYDFWIDELSDFDLKNQYELILTGSFGSGKTTAASIFILYRLYYLFSYRNFHSFLNIPSSSYVYGVYLSISKTQAFLSGFRNIIDLIDSSKFFQDNFPRDKEISSRIVFKNIPNFEIIFGSAVSHVKGLNVWFVLLDEADFFKKGSIGVDSDYIQVTSIYNEIASRLKSRFKSGRSDKSFIILISSASFKSSFLDTRIKESVGDEDVRVVNAVGYKIKPEYLHCEKFPVFIGYNELEPIIIEDINSCKSLLLRFYRKELDLSNINDLDDVKELYPDFYKYIEFVPINFKNVYKKSIYTSLMNLSGIPVQKEGRLVSSLYLLYENYSNELYHPFTSNSVVLSSKDDIPLSAYFLGHLVRHKEKPHAIHIDQSVSKDSTGISMVRFDGVKDGIRHYSMVFSLEIKPPPPPDEIKISKIRDFVVYLVKDIGYNVISVTTDQYQSKEHQQILKYDYGIESGYYSVDKSDEAYILFLSLLQDRCISLYKYEKLETELIECVHDRKRRKVDHPKGGCFTGDTLIYSTDFGYISFKDCLNHDSINSLGVDINGEVVDVVLYNFRITRYESDFVRVYISDYTYFDCTLDHLWLLDNGEYVEAKDLIKGYKLKNVFNSVEVFKVEFIHLSEVIPFYDCTSLITHNFSLYNGCIVHNSIDVLQSLVGALYNLVVKLQDDVETNFIDISDVVLRNKETKFEFNSDLLQEGYKLLSDSKKYFEELNVNLYKRKLKDFLDNLS